MDVLKTILKIFSLFIAGLNSYAAYVWYQYEEKMLGDAPRLLGEYGYIIGILGTVLVIGFPLAFIWFGEYISDDAEQRGQWAPTGLINFAGWIFLLIPATIFIWYTIK